MLIDLLALSIMYLGGNKMKIATRALMAAILVCLALQAIGQTAQKVVDIPTRPGVRQRVLVITPAAAPQAAVILLAGGHGGLQIYPNGSFKWGEGNFLVRSRQLFVDQGLMVVVLDAPSDRQSPPYLNGFRQMAEHAQDIKAVIAWLREQAKVPVWLVGTSRGTQSAAYAAIELSGAGGPDGVVLTSTILSDPTSRSVNAMQLSELRIPVLVIHHEQDGCSVCRFSDTAELMDKLVNSSRKQLLTFKGGSNRGDPCAAFAYHGFNGLESDVVAQTAAWLFAK
jgi:pimeloyl-ACP methyl ester carboxylesterase